jgi:hypothetical protein
MPQIQVIGREALEDTMQQRNLAAERERTMGELANKHNTLKLYRADLEYKKQVAASDAEKEAAASKLARAKHMETVLKNASDIAEKQGPEAAQSYMGQAMKVNQELISQTMKDGLKDYASKLSQSGQEQYASTQAEFVRKRMLGEGSTPGQPVGDNASRMGAVNGEVPQQTPQTGGAPGAQDRYGSDDMVVTSMGPSGLNYTSKKDQADLASTKTYATEKAKQEITLQKIRKPAQFFMHTFDQAVEEMGGQERMQILASLKGTGAQVMSKIGYMPATQAFGYMAKSFAIQLAVHVQGSRPSDKDAEAMAGTLVKLQMSKGTSDILRQYLDVILNPDADPEDVNFASYRLHSVLQSQKKSKDPQFPSGRFTIEEIE